MRYLLVILVTLIAVPVFAQPFITVGSSVYLPQDSYVRQTDNWSINAELSAGFRSDWYGLTVSGNVPVKSELRSIKRLSFDAYPLNWLVVSAGASSLNFTESGFTAPVETNSLGVMGAIALELPINKSLKIGMKGQHDFHGADINQNYEWLGGTTGSLYMKVSF